MLVPTARAPVVDTLLEESTVNAWSDAPTSAAIILCNFEWLGLFNLSVDAGCAIAIYLKCLFL
jgi:hypothetical protein